MSAPSRRRGPASSGIAALTVAAAACSTAGSPDGAVHRIHGDSAVLGDGIVRAWVETGPGGRPVALGVDLPDVVIASVPDESVMLGLDFPEMDGLPFRHVLFDWGPDGHPPADLYADAHWDAHFYTLTQSERRSIGEGRTELRPRRELLPDGFIPVPSLGLYAFPQMGVHWVGQDAGELHGRGFDQTLIYGSWGTRTIFVEPMFTQAFLATGPDVDEAVPRPREVGEPGWYATRYVIRRNREDTGYRIALEGLRWRD